MDEHGAASTPPSDAPQAAGTVAPDALVKEEGGERARSPKVESRNEEESKGRNALATSSKVKLEDFDKTSGQLKVVATKRLSRREIEAEEEQYAARATAM